MIQELYTSLKETSRMAMLNIPARKSPAQVSSPDEHILFPGHLWCGATYSLLPQVREQGVGDGWQVRECTEPAQSHCVPRAEGDSLRSQAREAPLGPD